jgi:hypothetical protein
VSVVARGLAALGLALLFAAIAVAIVAGIRTDGDDTAAADTGAPTTPAETTPAEPAPSPAPTRVAVRLRGLRGFDPEGDGRERDETAPLATDGEPATFWQTENYRSFFKNGVGLLLDAGEPVTLTRVVVTTDTPGVVASLRVGATPGGPFAPVSRAKPLARTTTFTPQARAGRYVVVWVEEIPDGGSAHVNEVRAWRAGGSR